MGKKRSSWSIDRGAKCSRVRAEQNDSSSQDELRGKEGERLLGMHNKGGILCDHLEDIPDSDWRSNAQCARFTAHAILQTIRESWAMSANICWYCSKLKVLRALRKGSFM